MRNKYQLVCQHQTKSPSESYTQAQAVSLTLYCTHNLSLLCTLLKILQHPLCAQKVDPNTLDPCCTQIGFLRERSPSGSTPEVVTPVLDALAADGAVLERLYTVSEWVSLARASTTP